MQLNKKNTFLTFRIFESLYGIIHIAEFAIFASQLTGNTLMYFDLELILAAKQSSEMSSSKIELRRLEHNTNSTRVRNYYPIKNLINTIN